MADFTLVVRVEAVVIGVISALGADVSDVTVAVRVRAVVTGDTSMVGAVESGVAPVILKWELL